MQQGSPEQTGNAGDKSTPPPLEVVYAHHLPVDEIKVYHRRKTERRSRPFRRRGFAKEKARMNRSMSDLDPVPTDKAIENEPPEFAKDGKGVYRWNKSMSDLGDVDLYTGHTLQPSARELHPTSSTFDARTSTMFITIAPGVKARVRGAQETHDAIQRNSYIPTKCFGCFSSIFCIADASYALCPRCKVVSPLGHDEGDDYTRRNGGIGIGFTQKELDACQS